MMKAAPTASFEMTQSDFLLEFLIVALDTPAQLGQIDQTIERDFFRKRREPVFDRLRLAFGPFDQQPFFGPRRREIVIAMGRANAQARKTRSQLLGCSLAPRDRPPSLGGQTERQRLHRDRLMLAVAAHQPRRASPARPGLG